MKAQHGIKAQYGSKAQDRLRRSIQLPGLLLLTLLLSPSRALVAQQEQPGIFSEVIDVRVVNIEVVVTEKGNRVTGLGADDLILTVDGKEVAIEYFTEVLGGTAVVGAAGAAGGTVPALAPGEDVGTSYLVFIDEFFARPTDRNRVVDRMIEQLPNLLPEDRMAIVAYDGKQVEMLSTWSQSVEALTRVLEKARLRKAYGLQRQTERELFDFSRQIVDQTIGDGSATFGTTGLDAEEQYLASLISSQVERVVLAASSTLRSFANPPGRKVMLLLSGGWPYNPAYWVINDPTRAIYADAEIRDGQRLYRPLIETANRLSYTLYTVDLPVMNTDSVNADVANVDDARRRSALDRDRELDEHLALRNLARETGGQALIDSAGSDAFERVVADTRSYYWIGFTPDWQGDDAAHKVAVKTRNKKYQVRSRKGFSDLSRETEVTMMVESSLLFGNPPSAAPLGVTIGAGKKSGRGKVVVPLRVLIPVGELTFLPRGDAWAADTELRVAVLDDEGNTADIPVIPIAITTPQQPSGGTVTVYETTLKLRKRKHSMVISLYDKASGKILSTKLEVDPAVGEK